MKTIKSPIVRYITSTPNPRRVVAIAARMTYSPRDIVTLTEDIREDEIHNSIISVLQKRHFSVLRHAVYTFTVSGVSRALSHQLVRHTVGHSFEQRSQHYRIEKDPSFIEPDTMTEGQIQDIYEAGLAGTQASYEALIEAGVPKEDARMILPNATETQLIWTANLEAILNFVQTRACRVNTSEIMSVAVQVRNLIKVDFPEIVPFLGPTCFTRGVCYEGDKFYKVCNKPWKSPTVLWRPNFPAKIELVAVGGKAFTLDSSNLMEDHPSLTIEYSPNPKEK